MKKITLIATLLVVSLFAAPASRAGLLGLVTNLVTGTVSGLTSLLDPLFRSLRSFAGTETIKYSLHYEVTGSRIATTADSATFRFSGPLTVATVDQADANWQVTPMQVGSIDAWDVTFRFKPGAAQPPVNTDTEVSSRYIRMRIGNNAMQELLDNPATLLPETNIPFNGRMLFELGRVQTAAVLHPHRYRVTGCLGLQSTSLFGEIAGKRGVMCTSGTFNFPVMPMTIADIKSASTLSGASNVTIVVH